MRLLKQPGLLTGASGEVAVQMGESKVGSHTPAGGALDKSFLDEEGLVNFLNGAGILVEGRGKSRQAHGATAKLVDDGREQFVVNLVKAIGVDVERLEGIASNIGVDFSAAFHLREVAHASQQ